MEFGKSQSFISVLIWGPSKIPAFNFSIVDPENLVQIYLKLSPSSLSAFTNGFMIPNLIWRGSKMILDLSTRGWAWTFFSPGTNSSLTGQSCFIQGWALLCCPTSIESMGILYNHTANQVEIQPFLNQHKWSSCVRSMKFFPVQI